jgi:Fe2+ transport system protein FeoA
MKRCFMTLVNIKIGTPALIKSIGGRGGLRRRLLDMGLIPGTVVTVIKTAPMGDPLILSLRGYELSLRKEDASRIEIVEKI